MIGKRGFYAGNYYTRLAARLKRGQDRRRIRPGPSKLPVSSGLGLVPFGGYKPVSTRQISTAVNKKRLRRGDEVIPYKKSKKSIFAETAKAGGKFATGLYGMYKGAKYVSPYNRMTPAQARQKFSKVLYYETL